MPIYEYLCSCCNLRFERIETSSAVTPPRCPSCDSADVVRAPSSFSSGENAKAACFSGG